MEIINLGNYIEKRFHTGVALGNFDGLHLGHRKLISSMIETSKTKGLKSSILLFNGHTKAVTEGNGPQLLTSLEKKLQIFSQLGVDVIYTIDFGKKIRQLNPEEFITKILIDSVRAKVITVGYDYRFGYKALGDIELLKRLGQNNGIAVNVIEAQCLNGKTISSTQIREYIIKGLINEANNMLGRNYSLSGTVIHGKKIGRQLGYPTANLMIDGSIILPKSGVYATIAIIDNRKYYSVTSIGKNPTFHEEELKVETHILDFAGSLYGTDIELEFLEYIRNEEKFSSLEDLKNQIKKDVNYVNSK